ncbi:MAG: tRNA dihydrouridine synthase DusB [bacterium]|nr:tRNA dihydrouridine synthase DusB [bacterium]
MNIGSVKLKNNFILAPMAGVTDLPFRRLVVAEGCGLVVTEMVSAKGLVLGGSGTRELLAISPDERPVSVQIFGADFESMGEAASIIEEQGGDILDINMGCPVKKVVGPGGGSALLKEINKVEKILKSVRRKINIPLTVKIRSGWDSSSIVILDMLKAAEDSGVDAIAIHPRTKTQGYSGLSNWDLIARMKEVATIPVIGNGDVRSPEDVARMIKQTGCDAVMIGRAAMGNPWIFSQTISYMNKGAYRPPTAEEKMQKVLYHFELIIQRYGPLYGTRIFRKHLGWYSKGMAGGGAFRQIINRSDSAAEVEDLIRGFFAGDALKADPSQGSCSAQDNYSSDSISALSRYML